MCRFLTGLVFVVMAMPGAALSQESGETLADIRQELSVLYVEIQKLKRELSTTGATGDVQVGGSLIDRVNAIEGEVQRLTSKTEELEFRIDSVVSDGTNRIGDLEFRLCELESGCDVSTLEPGDTLGGVAPATGGAQGGGTQAGGATTGTADSGAATDSGVQMAVGEQADFDAAKAELEAGNHAAAAEKFAQFQANYPGGPLSAKAGLMQGEALEGAGEMTRAARAYLNTFSAAPNGPEAPQALYRLGRALGKLGQTDEACVTLGEVEVRFPGGEPAQMARTEMQSLGCQ